MNQRWKITSIIGLLLAASVLFTATAWAQYAGSVLINGREMNATQKYQYQLLYGSPPVPGSYWYDKKTGFFGIFGGPVMGKLTPGLDYGPLAANASNGNTGIYINGRQLPESEVAYYTQLMGGKRLPAGRYWMDAQGNAGVEGPSKPQRRQQNNTAVTAGGRDQRVVGQFRGETIYNGTMGINTQLYWTFLADGRVFYGSQANMFGRTGQGSVRTEFDLSTGKDTERGRWSTSAGIMTLQWEDGSVGRFAYSIEQGGNRLVHRNPQTRKLINYYQRVR